MWGLVGEGGGGGRGRGESAGGSFSRLKSRERKGRCMGLGRFARCFARGDLGGWAGITVRCTPAVFSQVLCQFNQPTTHQPTHPAAALHQCQHSHPCHDEINYPIVRHPPSRRGLIDRSMLCRVRKKRNASAVKATWHVTARACLAVRPRGCASFPFSSGCAGGL